MNYAPGTENARLINERRRDERVDEFGLVDDETTTRVTLSNQRCNVSIKIKKRKKRKERRKKEKMRERERERERERDASLPSREYQGVASLRGINNLR